MEALRRTVGSAQGWLPARLRGEGLGHARRAGSNPA